MSRTQAKVFPKLVGKKSKELIIMMDSERQENWKQIFLDYESVNEDDQEIMDNIKKVIDKYVLKTENKGYYESLAFFLDLYPDYDDDSHFLD